MTWFNSKVIGAISPTWALKREKARAMLRAYEAVTPGPQRKIKRDARSADGTNRAAIKPLREIARHLEENHDLARGVLNTLVNNIVGESLTPEPKIRDKKGEPAKDLNKQVMELFRDWAMTPESTHELHWNEMNRLLCRHWLRDGEVFAKHLKGKIAGFNHGTTIPYSLELLEADYCPETMTDERKRLVQGIRRNDWGQPVEYFFYDTHPGDSLATRSAAACSADIVSHLKLVTRLRQSRGVSIFASVMNRLDDLKDYEEAERIAARVAAMAVMAIKRSPDMMDGTDIKEEADGKRYFDWEPGSVFDNLLPGESPEILSPSRPSQLLMPFRDGMMRAVASGTGSSYSSISKNYDGTYSSQRQELVESYQNYKVMRDSFVHAGPRKFYTAMVQMALANGDIKLTNRIDLATLYDVDFQGQQMPWIDPLKEANANVTLVENKLKTRSQCWRENGLNPQHMIQQLKEESEIEILKPAESVARPSTDTEDSEDSEK